MSDIFYDPKCAELAAHFLNDPDPATWEQISELAEVIQRAVDGWLEAHERPVTDIENRGDPWGV